MVQPDGEADSRGKAVIEVVDPSDESKTEYNCPRCFKTFFSTQSLCGHQNAHRLVKEPMKMSPVLAAVLNNPPPPFHKPFLIPPRPKPDLVDANKAAARELGSKKPAAYLSPRYHPYNPNPNQLQDKFMKKTTTTTTIPEGGCFLRQLLRNQPRHRQMVVPNDQERYTNTDTAMDLLGEWRPISCFGEDSSGRFGIGTSSGKKVAHPVSRINYVVERERDLPDLELCLRPPGGLDLKLKLGWFSGKF